MDMIPVYGFLGLVVMVLSFLFGIATSSFHFHVGFELGCFMFLDSLELKCRGSSLIHGRRYLAMFTILFVSAIVGAVFDVFGVSFFHAYHYPVLASFLGYVENWFLSFGIFGLIVFSSVRVMHAYVSKPRRSKVPEHLEPLFGFVGLIGISLLLITFGMSLRMPLPFSLWMLPVPFLGLWLVLEYVAYERTGNSVLTKFFRGDFSLLTAIIAVSVLTGIVWELMNYYMASWVWLDVPLGALRIGTVPVIVLVVGWPVLYLIFLSACACCTEKVLE